MRLRNGIILGVYLPALLSIYQPLPGTAPGRENLARDCSDNSSATLTARLTYRTESTRLRILAGLPFP